MKNYASVDANVDTMRKVDLCRLCDCIYQDALKNHKDKDRLNLLPQFIKEDYGSLCINKISKDMIDARKNRSLGKSPWTN